MPIKAHKEGFDPGLFNLSVSYMYIVRQKFPVIKAPL